jgi:DNA-binding transcriptional LysR family regulator
VLIDLLQLRTFVAVAEERHLTRAADRLHISQSAASVHIRSVEDSLGTRLFVRTNRSLELTHAGQLLLHKAKALLNDAAQFASFARELEGRLDGSLVIGTASDPVATRISQVVAALRARHPLIRIDLRARPSLGTPQGIKTGELDAGVVLGRPVDAGLSYYELATLRYRAAGPAQWKAQIEGANWPELARLPWISATDTSVVSNKLSRIFADMGLTMNTVVQFDNASIVRGMVSDGIGMMLMREEYALQGERDGLLAVSPIAHVECPLYIAHLVGRGDDPLIRALVEAAAVAWPEMKPAAQGM